MKQVNPIREARLHSIILFSQTEKSELSDCLFRKEDMLKETRQKGSHSNNKTIKKYKPLPPEVNFKLASHNILVAQYTGDIYSFLTYHCAYVPSQHPDLDKYASNGFIYPIIPIY